MSLQGHMATETREALGGGPSMEAVGRERDGGQHREHQPAVTALSTSAQTPGQLKNVLQSYSTPGVRTSGDCPLSLLESSSQGL